MNARLVQLQTEIEMRQVREDFAQALAAMRTSIFDEMEKTNSVILKNRERIIRLEVMSGIRDDGAKD